MPTSIVHNKNFGISANILKSREGRKRVRVGVCMYVVCVRVRGVCVRTRVCSVKLKVSKPEGNCIILSTKLWIVMTHLDYRNKQSIVCLHRNIDIHIVIPDYFKPKKTKRITTNDPKKWSNKASRMKTYCLI